MRQRTTTVFSGFLGAGKTTHGRIPNVLRARVSMACHLRKYDPVIRKHVLCREAKI